MSDIPEGLITRAKRWRSERGQISGSLASMRKHDADGAKILRAILKQLDQKDHQEMNQKTYWCRLYSVDGGPPQLWTVQTVWSKEATVLSIREEWVSDWIEVKMPA